MCGIDGIHFNHDVERTALARAAEHLVTRLETSQPRRFRRALHAARRVRRGAHMTMRSCKILEFPKIPDPRGNLTFVESSRTGDIAQRVARCRTGVAPQGRHAMRAVRSLASALRSPDRATRSPLV
jgi:hypothetical protein